MTCIKINKCKQQNPSSEVYSCAASQQFLAFPGDKRFNTVVVTARYYCPQIHAFLWTNSPELFSVRKIFHLLYHTSSIHLVTFPDNF